MKTVIKLGLVLFLVVGLSAACPEQTVSEKVVAVKNDAVRAVKKTAHRAEEALCDESDAECLAKKAKNRVEEAADVVVDKADEVKDLLD